MILHPIIQDAEKQICPQAKEISSLKREDWLQELIHKNPQLYPIENDLRTGLKIISLGREINCGAGFIDILLLTSDAEIIVVETKLWKNPEKSRTVLAQIIDYAKELSNWSFDDLNSAITLSQTNTINPKTRSIDEIIQSEFPHQNIIDFEERLIQNLSNGNIKLSIIGDKISPNLLLLSDTIQKAPGLNFNITLIEIKLFEFEKYTIIIPDIVGKTIEETRAVVKIQYEKEKPRVDIKYFEPERNTSKTSKSTFISECPDVIAAKIGTLIDKWESNNNLLIYWGIRGFSIRKLTKDKYTTILDLFPDCISMIIQSLAEQSEIPENMYSEYLASIFKIDGLKSAYTSKKRYIYYKKLNVTDLDLIFDAVDELLNKLTSN
jgi:hypothetical protein